MSKRPKQNAGPYSSTPALSAGLTPGVDGIPVNFLRSGSDFAEFRGVPVNDRILNVRIQYAAIRELRAALAAGSGEVLGLLLGSEASETLSIQGFEPVLLAGNPDVAWLRAAVGRFTSGAPGLIGFFRTQLTGRPEITRADAEIIQRHLPTFAESGGFFAVIETPRANPWSASLYALDSDGTAVESNAMLQFPFNENLLRKMFSSDFVPEFEPARSNEISTSTSANTDVAKRSDGIHVDLKNSRLWMIGALCIAGLLGMGVLYTRSFSGRTRVESANLAAYQPLGLKVSRSGSDFEVSWDRTASVVRLASDGTLTIRDGQITKIVNLDPTQLREGRVLYSPLFRELTVRLEISDNQRRMGGESVQVLGWDTNPSSDLVSANPSVATPIVSKRPDSPPLLPSAAPPAMRVGTEAARVQDRPDPRVTPAPRPAEVSKAPEAKAIVAEAPPAVRTQTAAAEPVRVVATPAQIPARTTETAAARAETAPAAAPVAAVAPPAPISKPASSQPPSSQPVASPPAAPPTVTSQPSSSQAASTQSASQPIKVTSNLQSAKLIKMVTPVYPSLAKATRIQGTVSFNANIGGDGRIRKLQYTSGPSVLVAAAADAVKQWIYQPTLLDGQPIEVNTNIDVRFTLNQK